MSYRPWLDKISSNDATNPLTPSYFQDKLLAGDGITLTVNNDGAVETVTVAGDRKVFVSSSDTTAGYLGDKLIAGTGMALTITGSTDEVITFASTVEGGYWEPLISGDTDGVVEFYLDEENDILMVQIE